MEMPRQKEKDWKGIIASLLVHALILFLIIAPIVGSSDFARPNTLLQNPPIELAQSKTSRCARPMKDSCAGGSR